MLDVHRFATVQEDFVVISGCSAVHIFVAIFCLFVCLYFWPICIFDEKEVWVQLPYTVSTHQNAKKSPATP